MNINDNAVSSPIMSKFAKTDALMATKNDNIETFEPFPMQEFNSLLTDSEAIIEQALGTAYRMVNILLVKRNWLLGKRIA